MDYDVHNPTFFTQDMCVLSKGHTIATLVSVYADIGYFEKNHLEGSSGYAALIRGPQGSKPTAIICQSNKGIGGFAAFVTKHKAIIVKEDLEVETCLLYKARAVRVGNLNHFQVSTIERLAGRFGYRCVILDGTITDLIRIPPAVSVSHPDRRTKNLEYTTSRLPVLEEDKEYAASDIIKKAMSAFAQDMRLHAINAGIAECRPWGTRSGKKLSKRGNPYEQ